jgi:hypothetical protein
MVCVVFVIFDEFLKSTKISRFYKVYLMPGPFFREASIATSHHMLVVWKENETWTTPTNHALQIFNQYQSTFNPVYLNESRLERALFEETVRKSRRKHRPLTLSANTGLVRYVEEKIIPVKSDSVSIIIIQETSSKKDSVLFNQKFRVHD